jgi:V/A-type H+-transporting ATPase subunit I
MLFPQEMSEIELIVPEKDLLAVTNVLAGRGVFHQVDSSHLSSRASHDESTDSWKERAAEYAALERQILTIMQSLSLEEGAPTSDQTGMVEIETIRPLVDEIELAVKDTTNQLAASEKTLTQLPVYIRDLEPLAGVDLDISVLRNPRYVHSILGTMPIANMERLETSLMRTPFVLMPLREEGKDAVVWLTGAKGNADILDRAARSAYLNPFEFTHSYDGTPAEIIKALNNDIQTAQGQVEKQKVVTARLRETYQKQLQQSLWSVRTSRMLADTMSHFGKLKYTYLIVGWVPSTDVPSLSEQLKRACANIIIDTKPLKPTEGQSVPVSLHNPPVLSAFELLVNTFARPRYEEIDPTILIAITFPLLFGAMFGDVGHGLMLALLGVLLIVFGRRSSSRVLADGGTIIVICGLSATVFGFLYGSIFSFEDKIQALWMHPIENMLLTLGVAIGLGLVILSIGYLLNLYNAFRARNWGRLLFDPNGLAGLVLFWSMLGLVASSFLPGWSGLRPLFIVLVVLAAVTGVVLSEPLKNLVNGHRPLIHGGIGMFALQSFFELLEKFISLFSNSMSYVRVGAFAIAHAGLSSAVFVFAAMASHGTNQGFGYWVVVVIGNLFIVGFEGVIVGIQTMRLHYYEFFSKFFLGGGASYEPLTPVRAQEK